MQEAAREAAELNLSSYERMKSIARAYVTSRELSAEEAAYHVLPELSLKVTHPQVKFANTNLPENRYSF